jgi:hypothetical protein
MNESTDTKKVEELSLAQTGIASLRHYLDRRRGLIVLAAIALGAGLVLNWSWLVAMGLAPLILALAPCAAMCALGLCMNKMADKPGSGSERSVTPGVTGAPEATAAPMANEETRKIT